MGAIAGLVKITPTAAHFVDIGTAFFFGVAGAGICRLALRIKFSKMAKRLRWVDNGDTFATHCVGGVCWDGCYGVVCAETCCGVRWDYGDTGDVFLMGIGVSLGFRCKVEAVVGFVRSFVGSYVLFGMIDCIPRLEVLTTDRYVMVVPLKTESTSHLKVLC